ncbi:MAG: YfhO family protein, partial [Lachnospiraceae bacterium]|nr:YfhO family protein [Lachnospiraceae bacterium]
MGLMKAKEKKESKPITSEQYRKLFLFLSFFVPFEMMLVVFAVKYCFPFGDQCFLISDLYHQYFPFFQEFSNKIRSGEGIFYSWNMGLGTNFYVIYAYYLACPLNWIAFLFPKEYLAEVISGLVILKVGLAGLTSYLFFDNRNKEDKITHQAYCALLFSFCYAMSGYVAAYNINIMWMDCIVLAPLILLGLERLVKRGSIGIYTISL